MRRKILCDTRQQAGKHVNIDSWFEAHGVEYEYRKLDFGDYSTAGGESNISIDTKQGMVEVAGNLGRDHARFVRELQRARDAGYLLIILIEDHPQYNDRSNIFTWVAYPCRHCRKCNPLKTKGCAKGRFKPMQGPAIAKQMFTLEKKYGCRFEFCSKRDTARIICERLGVEYE